MKAIIIVDALHENCFIPLEIGDRFFFCFFPSVLKFNDDVPWYVDLLLYIEFCIRG